MIALLRVALAPQKRLLALRHRIVFVLNTFVLVPTALQRRTQHALPTMLIFVRRVTVDITRPHSTHALHVPVDNTKTTVGSPLAKHVPGDNTAVSVHRVVRILQLLAPLEPMPVV